jgi:hypothetical protein
MTMQQSFRVTKDDVRRYQIERALEKLRQARDMLKANGAPRAADKVRRAMKSTEGAIRHADHMAWRNK